MPIAYILSLAFLVGCSSVDVSLGIRDLDGDHITECQVSDKVLSNKECVFEIKFEKELTL